MSYQLLYSETSRKQIRKLHPQIKPVVKSKIERLQENLFSGKWLEKELSGYLSMQAKRFRVIYKIRDVILIISLKRPFSFNLN